MIYTTDQRVGALSMGYAGKDITTWGDAEWIIPASTLQRYGEVDYVVLTVHGAAPNDAMHQVWVDDIEFGPAVDSVPGEAPA